ncbi:galactose-6-phosphate isomerase subunit LacA [Clostridium sp. P21]|uniref:Galactose-6-phosphate isomerase subunit LacA n=1 Tax=Clostridium muellerianum TaxID=2716538 RepID=A0A7Y0EKU9_9CLOT|nr:RpiB/LacA/LacB family sugar-phosphate isomerase [Clostridium muellerianum]NMM65334.1 galactose-6-phosphate isomerase subunit LacA [Clostridium muellerianum]
MKIAICSDKNSVKLKNVLKEYIKELGHNVKDYSDNNSLEDYLNQIVNVSKKAAQKEFDRVIFIDAVGGKSFIISSKVKGMVTACVSDEHSAKMTRDHNGSLGIAIGSDLVGEVLAKNLVKIFIEKNFSAGRHMVRIDMLNKMA